MTSATDFWQEHQVGGPYKTLRESQAALNARAALYPDLYKLMPTEFPGKTILDFGCGPGHDTIQFLQHGAEHVWFADISWQALETTSVRVNLHGFEEKTTALFADDALPAVDRVHCAGVLHHMYNPEEALLRLRRCSPKMQAMVYDGKRSKHTQSLDLAAEAGWDGEYVGSYECSSEWRPKCFAACFALA
jgi:2-polyprenyl-3-methyl-5-hydroxy-6-metoxy-1,4-benzoquinol methylase